MTVSQKNENCANYLLASGFDFTPDFLRADLISIPTAPELISVAS
ncbi:hypothetical protein AVDCRST_MAG84-7704 [uncultured Microcoleus sp.]|uniref:Uncharacterized protein n=1 Tax=uncultured Microcoleus sp. TaxID=259945 RepID=A0A6J4Q3R8_9CYAN|nr:hypothetical protein AVDCRST_MAG84-7704 [uncultured Microcoleus sp.]